MKEYSEDGDSDIDQSNNDINDKIYYGNLNKKIMIFLYLILLIILVIIVVVFIILYCSKIKKYEIKKSDFNNDNSNKNKNNNNNTNINNTNINNTNSNDTNTNDTNTNDTNTNDTNTNIENITNEIICDDYGFFLPEDDKTECVKCSIENCTKCFGSKLNHYCNKCEPGLIPIYEENKIILCSFCNEGYYLINGECKKYSFRAKYKSDGKEIKLINSYIKDISEIKEMYVDGQQVESPDIKYEFDDKEEHEILMLVNITDDYSSMYQLFQGIDKMTFIYFSPFFKTSKVEDMGYMFDGCSSLTSIGLSNFDTSIVENMGHMFFGCKSLRSIGLSNFDTSSVTIMDHMFNGCNLLKSIALSKFKTKELNSMNSMFCSCYSLTSIDLSNFVTSQVYNMKYLFYYCPELSYINILNFSTNSNKVELFNLNISSSGTMITNKEFYLKLDKSYITGWKFDLLN